MSRTPQRVAYSFVPLHILLTSHYSLLAPPYYILLAIDYDYYVRLTMYYVPLTTHNSLFTVCYLLLTTHCLLFATYYLLLTYCSLLTTHSLLTH